MTRNGHALQLLTYVFAAIDHGSLRQAARVLRVQESSVSRNVVKLEQLLEMQLFERNVHGVRLTETGRAWIEIVRDHYDGLLDAFAERVRDNKDAKTLRIGLCWVTGGEFLKRLIARFNELYPDVRLAIEDVPARQRLAAIRRRRFDIVFTHGVGADKTCRSEVFWQERLFVLLPSSHSLVEKPMLKWSDLADMCLLVPVGLDGPPLDLRLLERIAADGGPAVQTCRANRATIIFKVQLGQGVTLAEASYARTVATDSAQWKPLDGNNSVSSIRGIWLDSNPKRAVLRLVGLAKNMAAAERGPEWVKQPGVTASAILPSLFPESRPAAISSLCPCEPKSLHGQRDTSPDDRQPKYG
ncbi:LysR family transcriptional regulator [Mesorhizobium sp. B2-4-17]|uniref:LysR substrate-binding domain-containing protein n=1 Tax=Mesorhizobium sp. B2-4-17 TaxID=2589932 RepID=UPI001126FC09|nr:LysR family transcriptional regulator [Mesorhizobium sp. B2-4-17]TPK72041.1 LysR family transcriptional regulator [Mesorhizobium sp. B2-4-17]